MSAPSALDSPDRSPAGPPATRAWWGDRGVRTKTLAAVAVTATVAVGVGVMGVSALGTSAASTQDLYENNIGGLEALGEMRDAIGGVRQTSRDAILAPTPELTEEALASLTGRLDDYHAAVEHYADAATTAVKVALVEEAQGNFDEYERVVEEVLTPLALASDYSGW